MNNIVIGLFVATIVLVCLCDAQRYGGGQGVGARGAGQPDRGQVGQRTGLGRIIGRNGGAGRQGGEDGSRRGRIGGRGRQNARRNNANGGQNRGRRGDGNGQNVGRRGGQNGVRRGAGNGPNGRQGRRGGPEPATDAAPVTTPSLLDFTTGQFTTGFTL